MHKHMGLALALAALMVGGKAFAEEGAEGGPKHKKMDPAQRFAKMDADTNGSVSREEFTAAHKERAQKKFEKRGGEGNFEERFAKHSEKLNTRFDDLDANDDGTLSQEELAAGGPPPGHGHKRHHKDDQGEPEGGPEGKPEDEAGNE